MLCMSSCVIVKPREWRDRKKDRIDRCTMTLRGELECLRFSPTFRIILAAQFGQDVAQNSFQKPITTLSRQQIKAFERITILCTNLGLNCTKIIWPMNFAVFRLSTRFFFIDDLLSFFFLSSKDRFYSICDRGRDVLHLREECMLFLQTQGWSSNQHSHRNKNGLVKQEQKIISSYFRIIWLQFESYSIIVLEKMIPG